jgi:methylated-DNA-[protein]-cysteine S-methyltransferase
MTPARDNATAALERSLRPPASDPAAVDAALRRALDRAATDGLVDVSYARTDSPIGTLLLAATPAGLVRLAFQREDDDEVLEQLAARVGPRVIEAPGPLDEARRELDQYFDGKRDRFELPLDWRLSSGFRRTVLETLYADVDFGQTVSYLQLATMVGNAKASRAVGTAMATNPIPIVVPCHRVLRSGGALGGYGGGLPAKVKLLELESGGQTLF